MEITQTNTMADALTPPEEIKFFPLADGIDVALLFSSSETGRWTILLDCKKDSFFPRHKHYGAGEYYVVKGRMEYRMGVAPEGTYGYEPLGVIHEKTTFTEHTLLHFTNYGPVLFIDDDDNISQVLDNAALEALCGKPKVNTIAA